MTNYDPMRDPQEQRGCRQALQRTKDAVSKASRERSKKEQEDDEGGGGGGGEEEKRFDPVEQARKAIDGPLVPRERQNQVGLLCFALVCFGFVLSCPVLTALARL